MWLALGILSGIFSDGDSSLAGFVRCGANWIRGKARGVSSNSAQPPLRPISTTRSKTLASSSFLLVKLSSGTYLHLIDSRFLLVWPTLIKVTRYLIYFLGECFHSSLQFIQAIIHSISAFCLITRWIQRYPTSEWQEFLVELATELIRIELLEHSKYWHVSSPPPPYHKSISSN